MLECLFEIFDTDSTGRIDRREFYAALVLIAEGDMKVKLNAFTVVPDVSCCWLVGKASPCPEHV